MSCGNAYCRFAQRCRVTDCNTVRDGMKCMEAIHWEDMEWDAECSREDDIPFCEPYDGPEDEDEEDE